MSTSFEPFDTTGGGTATSDPSFWESIGIDPTTISYTETSPTNEEIERTLGLTSSPWDFLKAVLSGKSSLGKAGSIAGSLGLAALANKIFGDKGGGFASYKGNIPKYTASRTMESIPQTMTVPKEGGGTQVVPRRPGSGGITYFSPMTYTPVTSTYDPGTITKYTSYSPPASGDTSGNTSGNTSGVSDTYQQDQSGLARGGIASLPRSYLGSYSDGGQLLRGPGDGVSDDIPATIANRQPARLADGEFVIPARIVSELGNGSTEAGARKLYAMMDRIKKARNKANDIAADTKTDRYLPR